ncbi:hypothetical protein JIX55_09415 [Streptomyces sp. DSM 40750]|nr:hypothetical protein JIX55_09415 [Streptomyces sp. DSM 40750]
MPLARRAAAARSRDGPRDPTRPGDVRRAHRGDVRRRDRTLRGPAGTSPRRPHRPHRRARPGRGVPPRRPGHRPAPGQGPRLGTTGDDPGRRGRPAGVSGRGQDRGPLHRRDRCGRLD